MINSRSTSVIRSSPKCPNREVGRSYSKFACPDSPSWSTTRRGASTNVPRIVGEEQRALGFIAAGGRNPAELSMPGMESQLNLAQHRLGLVALLGQLTRGDFAPRADRLHEGSICEFVLTCSLVTLTRALIGALLEKAVTESPRFLLGRHRTRCARLRHRIGEGHGCGYQQETKANQKTEPDDAQASRERCDPVSGADRWEFDRRESVKHAT